MAIAACASAAGLLLIIGLQYGLETETLRRQTLVLEAAAIAKAIANGQNPALRPLYAQYPNAYAFRVFDQALGHIWGTMPSANSTLLPPLPPAVEDPDDPVLRRDEQFGSLPQSAAPRDDAWMLTVRMTARGRGFWVQTAMIGDPAWQWRFTIGKELLGDGLLPVGVLVPSLTLAILLTTYRALRPLTRIAEQARALGEAAASGRALTPLSAERLPREFADVVSALNAMIDRLDRSLARQRQFASDTAHELRTPLAVLRLKVAELPDRAQAAQLDEELAGLAQLIGEMLRFAHAEDVMATERQPMDIAAVVRDACGSLAARAVARGIELELIAPDEGLTLPSHAELLTALVRNLVDNALSIAPPGSTVTIRVEPPGRVIVEDEGPGVPDAQKTALFARLWRAERQRRDGAGIGLALVRRIAQLHGGDVWVEDRPGGGARFVAQLTGAAA